jgi:DNA-directed RNA polymerase specialized sigma24 family protein
MSTLGSVTVWIAKLKAGDQAAAELLWKRYFQKLVSLARHKLWFNPRAAADEEDVALSAFGSFFRGVEDNRFPRLDGRDDLWQLLVLLTARKAYRLIKHERRQKRGGGVVQHLSAVEEEESGLADIIGQEPTPEFAAQMMEECRLRLKALANNDLREVAVATMEGYSNAEIADRLGVVGRTVQRRLELIRQVWNAPGDEA